MIQYVTHKSSLTRTHTPLESTQFPAFVGTTLADKYFLAGTCTEFGNLMG